MGERKGLWGINDYKMKSAYKTRTQAPNGICEARKCFAEAITIVKVSVGVIAGRQIAIPLSLCGNCVGKFDIIKEKEGEGLAPSRPKPKTEQLGDNTAGDETNNVITT
jgi:hypothetical protein